MTKRSGGVIAEDVEQLLPRTYLVKRGDIMRAFGFSKAEMTALVPEVFAPAPLPKTQFARNRFIRSEVIAVARRWSAQIHNEFPKQ